MKHFTTRRFWHAYRELPQSVQTLADKNFRLLTANDRHPSLRFKRVGKAYSVRVGIDYRALALPSGDDLVWFWIGTHADYDYILKSL